MTHKNSSRGLALRALSLGIAAALAAPHVSAQSLPTGGTAVTTPGGTAPTINTSGTTMTVTPGGARSLINWNTFDVAQGYTFVFNGNAGTDILVNRVTGPSFSTINGLVQSNANVWLINPNGITVGSTGVFDVAGLMLSTRDVADADVFDGDTRFNLSGSGNSVISIAQGAQLNAASGPGAIALIAGAIDSSGTFNAGTGDVALVGASDVVIGFDADLNAITTLTINQGSSAATAVTVGGGSQFTAGRTVIAAAGMTDGLGNILLNDDDAANNISFAGGDVILYAGSSTDASGAASVLAGGALNSSTPTSTGARIRTAGGRIAAPGNLAVVASGGIGDGSVDLNLSSAGTMSINGTARGRDVALNAGGSVTLTSAEARDDLVVRSNGITATGQLSSGVTVDGLAIVDVTGAGDALNGPTLSGNDMSLYGENGVVNLALAPLIGDSYRVRGTDFLGAALAPTWVGGGFENTFVITDTAGGFTAANLTSPGRLWIEVRNGGNLDVTGPLTSTRGDVQLITTGGGDINLAGTVTSGIRSGSTNEYVSLRSSGAINQTAGIIDTTQSTSGSLYVSAANGISLMQANRFATAAFQNSGAGGIQVRNAGSFTLTTVSPDSFNPAISGATTGSGNIDIEAAGGVIINAVPVTTGTGNIRLAGTSLTLDAVPVTTGAGNIVVDGATAVAGATTFSATGGTATFNGTIDGSAAGQGDLVVNATGTTFNGNVGATSALSTLTVNGATTLNAGTVRTSNGIDLDEVVIGAGAPAGVVIEATNGAVASGAITANHAGSLNVSGTTVNLASVTAPSSSLTLTATSGDLVSGAISSGQAVTIGSAGNARLVSVQSTGGAIDIDAIGEVTGATSVDRADLSATGNVSVNAGSLGRFGTITSGGTIAAITNGLDITAANATGILSLNGGAGGIALGSGRGNSTSLNTSGAVNVAGPLITRLLVGTAGGGATLRGANQIQELGNFTTTGLVLNNARALNISGTVNSGAGDTTIAVTGGNLGITSTGQVRGRDLALSTDANFINASGADAAVASGHWVIYSQAPAGNTFDGLDSGNTAIWNATLATLAPTAVSGNRYVFAFQPTLTFTTTNLTKVYGTDLAGNPGTPYTITGLQPGVAGAFLGDTAATAFTGSPLLNSAGFGARASVNGGPYSIGIANGTLVSPSGYAFAFNGAGQLTVTPLGITATGNPNDKTYDGTTTGTGSIVLNGVLTGDNVGATGTFTFFDANAGVNKQVTLTGLTLTGADAGNYTVTLSGVELADILQRAITVTADPKTKQAGDPDPALTWTITNGSLVTGDSLTGSLTRAPGEGAGTYAIGQGTLNASSNYRLTFVGSTLTITEEPVNPVPVVAGLDDNMEELLEHIHSRADGDRNGGLEVVDERVYCEREGQADPTCPQARPN